MFKLWHGFALDYLPYMIGQLELAVMEHAVRLSLYRGSTGFYVPTGMRFGDPGQYFTDDGQIMTVDSRFQYYEPDTVKKAVSRMVKAGLLIKRQGNRYQETRITVNLPGISKVVLELFEYERHFCTPETAEMRGASIAKDFLPMLSLVVEHYQHSGIKEQGVTLPMSTQTIKDKMRKALAMSAASRKKKINKLQGKRELTVPDMFRVIVGFCEDCELPYRERRTGKVNGMAKNFLKEKGTDGARSLLERAIHKWHLFYHSVACARLQKSAVLTESFSFELFYTYRMDIEAWLDENENNDNFAISCKFTEEDGCSDQDFPTSGKKDRIFYMDMEDHQQ
jgi:hypothetical protein